MRIFKKSYCEFVTPIKYFYASHFDNLPQDNFLVYKRQLYKINK